MTGAPSMAQGRGDAALVEASRRGDLLAWEQLVRRHQESAFRVAYLVTRDSAIAESATQSAFVRAYHALPQLEPERSLLPWLFRIVVGETRQIRRDASRPRPSSRPVERRRGPHYPASPAVGSASTTGLSARERSALVEAFDRLGEEDRLTLACRYLFHQSRDDAAAVLAIAVGLVDERLSTALRHLRARVADA